MTTRREYLLLALASADDGTLTPVQLQKAMFLLSQEAARHVGPGFYEFVPYNYGPFSAAIYEDVESLVRDGEAVTQRNGARRWPVYTVTGVGLKRAQDAESEIAPELRRYISDVVKWIKGQSFSGLLRAIYTQYPAFAVNSVFARAP